MFDLVTLSHTGSRMQKIRARTLEQYRRNGNHQISGVYTKKPGVYSSRLRHLVHRCLDPDPAKRPTQYQLLNETRKGLLFALKRAKRDSTTMRVYCRDHEINDMPVGDAGFEPNYKELDVLIINEFVNPDIPRLRLPISKYGHWPGAWFLPNWKNLYDEQNPHERWFKIVRPGGNSRGVDDDGDGDDGRPQRPDRNLRSRADKKSKAPAIPKAKSNRKQPDGRNGKHSP